MTMAKPIATYIQHFRPLSLTTTAFEPFAITSGICKRKAQKLLNVSVYSDTDI